MADTTELDNLPQNVSLNSEQQKEFSQKVTQLKTKNKGDDTVGVIYIGHIPHGFFEPQMKAYFSQFGKVNKLRIARSKKTGKIKGYAFVEFASTVVAKIVADSMNNYLMFHRLLKCQFLPMHKVHPETFKGSIRRFKKPKAHLLAAERHNKPKSEEKQQEAVKKMKNRKAKKLAKLGDLGIDFDFPGLVNIKGKEITDTEDMDVKEEMDTENLQQEAFSVLYEDSSEEEITMKTPPHTPKAKLNKSRNSSVIVPEEVSTQLKKDLSKRDKGKPKRLGTKTKSVAKKALRSKKTSVKKPQRNVKGKKGKK